MPNATLKTKGKSENMKNANLKHGSTEVRKDQRSSKLFEPADLRYINLLG